MGTCWCQKMSDDIDDDEVLIIVLGAVIAVLVLGGGIAGFCFYKRYKRIKEAKILPYRVEYTNSSPDNEVWIPPGPPQELQENIFWSDPRQTEESINGSGHLSQHAKSNEFVPLSASKFEP